MNSNMNIINMKKIYIRNQDMCFFYYRQIKYRKGISSPKSPFAGSKQSFFPDPSSLKPLTNSFHDLLHDISNGRQTSTHKETKVSCTKWGKCRRHKGLQTQSGEKSQHNNLSLSSLLLQAFPLRSFYTSPKVVFWLGTVGPRALTGDQQVKPAISA